MRISAVTMRTQNISVLSAAAKILQVLMWHTKSWIDRPCHQCHSFESSSIDLESSLLSKPGIVDVETIDDLRSRLSGVYNSDEGFILHVGDCAETFSSCNPERIKRDLDFIMSMGVLMGHGTVCIGRICGQFAKPRSSPVENHVNHGKIPVYRGDIINDVSPSKRDPDPSRMMEAYSLCSDMIKIVETTSVFTSHECLLLDYESSLVRNSSVTGQPYLTSAHFVWIGDRTREIDGPHIEFCRGVANPIGIKVGPSSDPQSIRRCVMILNPSNSAGKVTIITRLGHTHVRSKLPNLIEALRDQKVLWQCDPMHGNTVHVASGKTRFLSSIIEELSETLSVHSEVGSRLHGLHLEATGDVDVTECVGCNVNIEDLTLRFRSACDPRLNPQQTKFVLEHLIAHRSSKDSMYISDSCRLTTAEDSSWLGPSSTSSDSEYSECSKQ
jgi:3-deoxy-7-phosphoheptulonate synthase